MNQSLTYLKLKPAKAEEIQIEAQINLLGSFLSLGKKRMWEKLFLLKDKVISMELWSVDQKVGFYLVVPSEWQDYFSSQVASHYVKSTIQVTPDPALKLRDIPQLGQGFLKLTQDYGFSLKTEEKAEAALLTSPLSVLAKAPLNQIIGVQYLIRVPNQGKLRREIEAKSYIKNETGNWVKNAYAPFYDKKLEYPLLEVQARLISSQAIGELGGAYGVYANAEGNSLSLNNQSIIKGASLYESLSKREFKLFKPVMRLNLKETAGLWHLPDARLEHLKNIEWGRSMLSQSPDNLPVSENYKTDEERKEINFFAKTEWRNREVNFGIKTEDRRKHVYVIGKTGAGKSTLIANMAINDIRNGHGVAVIDPHGDLSEMILEYIPKRRINDVVYLDPTLATEKAFALNLFDQQGSQHTDVVASGIISVFYKLYHNSWGPRLEYILRNAILTLLYTENATFVEIITLLTDKAYRLKTVEKLAEKDPVIANYWRNEFDMMNDRLRQEAISPILNKVGQFLSSQRIRHIVGTMKSTFSLDEIMNQGKILILNLSQGKLGEDTTALLGAMFITKMQLTAMQRVNLPEDQRKDFYLYVDELQNFATNSFVKILSESRKYRLNLVMANQYIEQVDEEIQKAIFGNIGSLITFVIGARDALIMAKEMGQKFSENELVALGKFEILLKLSIDSLTSEPFSASTLPLPKVINANKEKIISLSLEKYYRKF